MKKALIILLAITLYCNIGWVVGSYYSSNITRTSPEQLTTLGKIAAGGWACIAHQPGDTTSYNITACVAFGILWPIGLIVVAATWVVYACYYASWFMVWGGGGRLLGLV